ncbi:hypothetical protein H0H92_014563 [Tricholoma furcatifolium]|nr:hypothetical protein H0H92_014563 [Tricholoma furcatifolium]
MSVMSIRATSLDVCEVVYGDDMSSMEGIGRLYEPNASEFQNAREALMYYSTVSVSGPRWEIYARMKILVSDRRGLAKEESDVNSDGHKKAIVEHTLNILLLPGIHCEGNRLQGTSDSLVSVLGSPSSLHPYSSSPAIRLPGTSLSMPSPFHFQLHIVTRLSFNEQGRVTHHRDFWDVKDVLGLVPGVSLAQWIGSRIAALGLSYGSKLWTRATLCSVEESALAEEGDLNVTSAVPQASGFATPTKDALRLNGV